MRLKAHKLTLVRTAFSPILIFALAAYVYSRYGLSGELGRDASIYLYGGQKMAEGLLPYVSIFDYKGPLAQMLPGFGVIISKQLGWSDIYTVRLVFFAIS